MSTCKRFETQVGPPIGSKQPMCITIRCGMHASFCGIPGQLPTLCITPRCCPGPQSCVHQRGFCKHKKIGANSTGPTHSTGTKTRTQRTMPTHWQTVNEPTVCMPGCQEGRAGGLIGTPTAPPKPRNLRELRCQPEHRFILRHEMELGARDNVVAGPIPGS